MKEGGETDILRLIEIIYVTKKKYLKGVIWMSEFSMRATTFKNKFGVAPCNCWKNPYKPAEYHIDPVYKSMGNFGNPRTEEVRVSCDECGYYGVVRLGGEYYKSDFS